MSVDAKIAKANEQNHYLWVVVRYTGKWEGAGVGSGGCVYVSLQVQNSQLFSIFKWQGGNWWWDIGKVDFPLAVQEGQWYQVKIEMNGTQAKLWLDEQLKVEVDWSHQAALPKEGRICVGGGGGEFHFDNLRIVSDDIQAVTSRGKATSTWSQLKSKS